MKFVNIRVTETTHKAALAVMKRDGVKLWKAVEVALLKSLRPTKAKDGVIHG